jgi:hypothetical protein
MKHPPAGVVAGCLAVLLFPAWASPQTTTGGVRGTVYDESRAVVPGATITVTNKSTGLPRETVSDSNGNYDVSNLAAGVYEVKAELVRFQTQLQTVTVLTGSIANADFQLKVGASSELIQVTSSTAQVSLTEFKVDGVITREQIQDLPLNGRSFLSLAQLEPGVSVTYEPNSGPGGPNNYFRVSIAGAPQSMTRISVDGASVLDRVTGGTSQNFSQETVEEFQLSSFNFDLSTGGTSTGSVNIVSRTGTNSIHGSGFYFFRDHNLAAFPGFRRPCDPAALNPTCVAGRAPERVEDPFFARRQTGFDVGGPIRKDRLFWFTNFEYTNQVGARNITFTDPLFATYNHVAAQPFRGKLFNFRSDYKVSNKHNAFLRYSQDTNTNLSGGNNLESTWIASRNWANQSLLGVTSVLNARTVNELRYSYSFYSNRLSPPDSTQCADTLYCFNLNGPRIGGFGMTLGNDNNVTQHRILRTYQLADNFTWQRSKHRIRFGGNWEHNYGHGSWARQFQGSFSLFSPAQVLTQSPALYAALPASLRTPGGRPTFAEILMLPASGTVSMGVGDAKQPAGYNFDKAARDDYYRLYIQDTWRLSSRFTLNYGLAWSFEDNLVNHDLDKPEWLRPVFGSNLAATRQDWNNFDPSLGFVWSLDQKNKTVLRAGNGVYHTAANTNYTRLPERAFIGPAGNGLNVTTSSGYPNPFASQAGQPAFLNFTVPTTVTGRDIVNVLPTVRSAFAVTGYDGKDLSVRGVDISKQAVGTNAEGIFDSDLTTSYTYHVSAGIQRELARSLIVSADFVMRRGVHFGGADTFYQLDVNRFNRASPNQVVNPTTGAVTYVRNPVMPICTAAQLAVPKTQCSSGQILQYRSSLNSRYRGLFVKVDKRFSRNYQFTVSYAWSRYVTWNGIYNYENINDSYGINGGDIPHRLVFSGIWNLPQWNAGPRAARGMVNGWQLSAISDMRTSGPGSPSIGVNLNPDGAPNNNVLPGMGINTFGRGVDAEEVRRLVAAFNAKYPTADLNATYRNRTPYNNIIPVLYLPASFSNGDTFFSTDLRLTRTIRFRERTKLQLMVEGFNVFNIANLTGYSNTLNALVPAGQVQPATFGQPTDRVNQIFGTGGPRAFQVGARLSW